MIDLDSLRADLVAEQDGAELPVPQWPGVKLKVRGSNYAPFLAARDAARQRLRLIHGDVIPADAWDVAIGLAMAEHLLVGWTGINVPYSRATAIAVLSDPAHRELRNAIADAANQVGVASARFVEDATGN